MTLGDPILTPFVKCEFVSCVVVESESENQIFDKFPGILTNFWKFPKLSKWSIWGKIEVVVREFAVFFSFFRLFFIL